MRGPLAMLVVVAAGVAGGVGATAHAQRPGKGEDESAALVDEGRSELRKGKLDAAAKALDQAIALNPRRVEAYVLRSAVYAAKKQHREGVELMRRALDLAPNDPDVQTALGSQLLLSGDHAAGLPLLQGVVAKDVKKYDAQLVLGHHFHDTAKWPEAIVALEAYFAARPSELAKEDPRHRVDLGDAYLRSRQPQKALELFQRAVVERKGVGDLRARVGVAWATAALDCRKARPLLRELDTAPAGGKAVSESYPEVWLVDGQCAIALGDVTGGLALGKKYLERVPDAGAAGHALVGEALAARGNLAEAKKELELARKLEPKRRRWAVRLAAVLRRAGDHAGAVATLDQLGPPAEAAIDQDWWIELAEALLAKGDAGEVVTRLGPVVASMPKVAEVRVVLGASQLVTGKGELAIATLTEAESIQTSPRGKRLLADALVTVAVAKLAEPGQAPAAEELLVRAEQLEATPLVLRNLGIALLANNKIPEATTVLDRAVKAEAVPLTQLLAARAHALGRDTAGARALYDKALTGAKDVLVAPGGPPLAVEVALDWAASELASGDANLAVTALEKVAVLAGKSPLADRHKKALAVARHAAGVVAIRAGNGPRAVDMLNKSVAAVPELATRCDLALATVVLGDSGAALNALRAVSGQSCPFPPPADTQAAPILIAFTEGISSARLAARAVDKLTALSGKSSGAAANLLNTAIRVIALEAAADAYRSKQLPAVKRFLATAKSANARIGAEEVAHDLAVVDLLDGKLDAAIAVLEKSRLPDALVNLGIAYERKGEPQKALDAWRKAKKAGVKWKELDDWIAAKERIYGGDS